MKIDRANRAVLAYRRKVIDRVKNTHPELAVALDEVRLDWYRIRNSADAAETTEVLIYDEIGGWCGLPADEFVSSLQEITTPNIDVRINSPGGSLFDGIAIYNALVKHPSFITTYVDSLAASAASIIAMGGDKCVMMVGAQMMIHDALGIEQGNAGDMRDMATFLDKQSENIATIYQAKAGGDAEDWRNLMLAETWMFAQEAVDLGLADEVYVKPKAQEEPPEAPEGPMCIAECAACGGEKACAACAKSCTNDCACCGSGPGTDEDALDAEIDALMRKAHRLSNRGYKHQGRGHAPAPIANGWFSPRELDSLLSNIVG